MTKLKTYIFDGLLCCGSGRLRTLTDYDCGDSKHFVSGDLPFLSSVEFNFTGFHGRYTATVHKCLTFASALANLKYALEVLGYDIYFAMEYTCISHDIGDKRSVRKIKGF